MSEERTPAPGNDSRSLRMDFILPYGATSFKDRMRLKFIDSEAEEFLQVAVVGMHDETCPCRICKPLR